jgi:hypothetical protein
MSMGPVVVLRNTQSLAGEEKDAWRDLARRLCMFPARLPTGFASLRGVYLELRSFAAVYASG